MQKITQNIPLHLVCNMVPSEAPNSTIIWRGYFFNMKETFIMRTEWKESILELSTEEQATIFQNLFHYHSGNENLINLNNLSVKLVWRLIEPNLKRNIESYDKRKTTSAENGKLGGRPHKNEEITTNTKPNNLISKPKITKEPNESLSVSVSDSVSVSGNKKVFIPPSILEVEQFFKEKGYSSMSAQKAFEYYDTAKWKDSKGHQVKNWKQKMIGVWFKDENKENLFSPRVYKQATDE